MVIKTYPWIAHAAPEGDLPEFPEISLVVNRLKKDRLAIVPEHVRGELASRAALEHKSMQEYLRSELERLASKPSVQSWLKTVADRKAAARSHVKAGRILRGRDADRK